MHNAAFILHPKYKFVCPVLFLYARFLPSFLPFFLRIFFLCCKTTANFTRYENDFIFVLIKRRISSFKMKMRACQKQRVSSNRAKKKLLQNQVNMGTSEKRHLSVKYHLAHNIYIPFNVYF